MDTGTKFPDFSLQNQDGKTKTLEDYKGGWTVFYVYPKDDTPGCTLQGKNFTAKREDFEALGATVVGVSADSVDSHKNFSNKYSFTIELLADPAGELISKLGIEQKLFNGQTFWSRSTFLVDPENVVRKIYENVNPEGHETVLLEDLKSLQ